ncbi:MAP7 domain-containing protein [Lacinutrix sp.]|uniref:MAP7 domain-containing protein n=1 Tax=Lacinutrix sp. TaxID=1937692 RepID=UPI0035C85D8F
MKQLITYSILFFTTVYSIQAQDCMLNLTVTLENINGGVFKDQTVTLTSKTDEKTYQLQSDQNGQALFNLPCNAVFDIKISNYTRKKVIETPNLNGGTLTRTFTYGSNMAAMDKKMAMSGAEKAIIKAHVKTLADTLFLKSSVMKTPKNKSYYAVVNLSIKDLNNGPLANEITTITGESSKKSIKTKTDKNGRLIVYVPKGDNYTVNFTYNKKYATFDTYYTKGSSNIRLEYSYLGTKEIERRKKEEAARIAKEELRLKEEVARFKTECERLKLTEEECRRKELEGYIDTINNNADKMIISTIFERNPWKNKLIVCDLTGSMSPYVAELSVWYNLNLLVEKNLQFVFFNDGDNKEDEEKNIGETGGVYYTSSRNISELNGLVSKVSASGSGGDCEENDLEALIKGTKLAKPFDHLVLIADSNSPVRDLELLSNLTTPVHVILCGYEDFILNDYLKIAWKTKGSIHTIEEDIVNIYRMLEGQNITIDSKTYKLMGGDFIKLN